jgi:hypothetical protein
VADVNVTTADGRRWVVDRALLSLPDDLSPAEEVRAAAAELLANGDGDARVPADLLGSWLDCAITDQGACCDFRSPCREHEKALAMARFVLGREPR